MDIKDTPQDKRTGDAALFAGQLFADEIINFLFERSPHQRFIDSQEYRETARYSDLYEALDKAADVIQKLVRGHVDSAFEQLMGSVTAVGNETVALMDYAEALEKRYFANGLDAEKFLYFAVHIASIAYKFHKRGVPKIDFNAFMIINQCFCDFGMFTGGLQALHEAADKILHESAVNQDLPSHYLDAISLEYFAGLDASNTEQPSSSKTADGSSEQSANQQILGGCSGSFIPFDILKSTSSSNTSNSSDECTESSLTTSMDKD